MKLGFEQSAATAFCCGISSLVLLQKRSLDEVESRDEPDSERAHILTTGATRVYCIEIHSHFSSRAMVQILPSGETDISYNRLAAAPIRRLRTSHKTLVL